jgi:hypothetical protein
MSGGHLRVRNDYLEKACSGSLEELAARLPAAVEEDGLHFRAFGEDCVLTKAGITLSGEEATGPEGLLIAMYAASAVDAPVRLMPLRSFKELPNSMPYQGAFTANSEAPLIPCVGAIQERQESIWAAFGGCDNPDAPTGDFSFTLYPLPRVPLYYIFYLADEELPASASCLFASNAMDFMPLDGLADVAEYTAKKILRMVRK